MFQCHEALRLVTGYVVKPDPLILTESDYKADSPLVLASSVEINIAPFKISNWAIMIIQA